MQYCLKSIQHFIIFKLQKLQNNYMDLTQTKRPKQIVDIIEPNTTRVLQLRRIKEQQERKQAHFQEQMRKIKQEQQRKKWTLQKMKQKEKQMEFQKRMEEQRRRREEQEQSNTLSGKFGHMINDLNTNTTNLQFTVSGMDLRPAQIKVLISNVQNNSSLKGLTMTRKKLTDVEGKQVSERLQKNQFLQRLELEGNLLGPQTLLAIARLLRKNETIRLVDLEGNHLVRGKAQGDYNYVGIDQFAEALKTNQTVLSINLNSTGLDNHASARLREMMQQNSTIILMDIENNPNMNIDDVVAIQDKLIANKQQHDNERYMQFIERKRMRRQQDISGVLLLNNQTKKLRGQAIELNIQTKKKQLDQQWSQFVTKKQILRQKQIIRMEKQIANKKGKKKRR